MLRSDTNNTQELSGYTDLNEVGGFRKTLALLSSPRVTLIYTRGPNFEMVYPPLFFPFLFFEVAFYVGFDNGIVRETRDPNYMQKFCLILFSKLIVDTVGQN